MSSDGGGASIIQDSLDYSLQLGQSKRITECPGCFGMGSSKAVQITRKEDGFLWHCFRCTKTGFVPDHTATESQIKQIISQGGPKKVSYSSRPNVVRLPQDFTTVLPPQAAVQLYNMELEPDDIKRYNIGFSPLHNRIVVPVYRYRNQSSRVEAKRELVGLMERKLDSDLSSKDKPKWLSKHQADIQHPRFVALPELAKVDSSEQTPKGRVVVVVEDVFSAIKVTKATKHYSIALLTTYFPYDLYPSLRGWHVIIWLDPDAYDKSCKYFTSLNTYGIDTQQILSVKDPKDTEMRLIKNSLYTERLPC